MDKVKADALARARSQIAGRISRLCRNLSAEEFDALLDRMAGIQCKYDSVSFSHSSPKTPPRIER